MDTLLLGRAETNSRLEGADLTTAIKFADKLITMTVFCLANPSITIFNTFPLFMILKPDQPGQYRTITNRKGGRNTEEQVLAAGS